MSHRGWKAAAGVAGLAVSVGLAMPAHATNGYFSNGYDAQSIGMAGAGLTLSQSATSATLNPALGEGEGDSIGGCFTAFRPLRKANVGAGHLTGNYAGYDVNEGQFTSKRNFFPIPCFGYNHVLDAKSSLGVLMYANGGMDTHYAVDPFRAQGTVGATGVDLAQAFLSVNYARKIGGGLTLGVAPVLAVQRFEAMGLQGFANSTASQYPNNVTNNGYSYSYGGGFKVGADHLSAPGEAESLGTTPVSTTEPRSSSGTLGSMSRAP